ncbi:unnamed protein product [Ixodes pacificus]
MLHSVKQTNFVEVPLRETTAPKWKELAINTGAAQSTLEDIKLAERAGGYVYQCTGGATRNRFIYWKTNNNVLELTEESLDVNLIGNRLRLRFQHTPLLEGVSIFETQNCVVVLAATVASVHRMSFPHPRRLNPDTVSRHHGLTSGPSVFFDASVSLLRDYHVLNHVGLGTTLSHNSCSWLGPNGEAIFVLGTNTSALFVVSIDPQDAGGQVSSMEIRKSMTVGRFLSNILPTSLRSDEASISLVCHQADDDVFIFALSRDLRIRQWSYRRQDLLMMKSVQEHCSAPTSRSACMYKATDSRGPDLHLGVYVSFPEKSEFLLFRQVQDHGNYKISYVTTVLAPESDLVDFCLTSSCLWTLWVKQNDEPVVCMKNFREEGLYQSAWSGVFLQRGVPTEKITVPTALDAREIYLEKIFGHGAFSYTTLSKALGMYSRRGESSANPAFSCRTLKDEVVLAVEAEIRASATEVSEAELADVEYVNLALKCWGRFYHTCIQYHEVGSKPLGLFVDPTSQLTALIRRDHISMLRPCERLESLVLSENVADDNSTLVLIRHIKEINSLLTADMLLEFAQGLYNMESPGSLATRLASQLTNHFQPGLQEILRTDLDLVPALKDLVGCMDLRRELTVLPDQDMYYHNSWNLLFTSMTGRDFVASCLCQSMRFRFTFCQDLLLLECLLLNIGNKEKGAKQKCMDIRNNLLPKTEALVRAYYVTLWATETEGSPVSSVLEGGINRLSLSSRSDGFGILCQNTQPSSLAWLFLRDAGGDLVRRRLTQSCRLVEECELWDQVLPAYIQATAELIWPFAPEYAFAKALLDLGQHLQLQEYVRLLGSWCKQNSGTCQFLLATSLLSCNEPQKACELFQKIAKGTFLEEPFLQPQIGTLVGDEELQSERSPLVLYFLRVIKAFEQAGHLEYVVELAMTALYAVTEPNDPKLPTLWSLVFRCQLELGHIKQAYDAIIQNPDAEECSQCLRQFVVVLCERRQLSTFVSFPFKEVINEVTSILKTRARATDLLNSPYYDVLYAMYVNAKRYREAAAMMHEYGSRLGQEVPGSQSLRRQQLCLLAAINCLLLAKPKYAWITSPLLVHAPANRSPKRDCDGEEVPQQASRRVEVITVEDIRRELCLIQAWLLLVESGQEGISTPLSPEETTTLLVVNGHFDVATKVCKSYQLDLDVVFEGLVSQCTRRSSGGAQDVHAIDPQWIIENPRAVLDIPEQAWSLLRHYLQEYESEPGITRYHRLVACQLLTHGYVLPPWFLALYKVRDPAELLRLYMTYGKLEDATDLAVEYVDATLRMGKEYFGLPNALHSTAPPVWLPHAVFDRLLVLLKTSGKMEEQHRRLSARMQEYLATLERVSAKMH